MTEFSSASFDWMFNYCRWRVKGTRSMELEKISQLYSSTFLSCDLGKFISPLWSNFFIGKIKVIILAYGATMRMK
jgi:hypothetical protein